MQDPKKSPKIAIWAPSHSFVGLYLHNQGMYRQSEKNLLSSNMSSRCPHNMVNIGQLMADVHHIVVNIGHIGRWFSAPQLISTGFASWQHYFTAVK